MTKRIFSRPDGRRPANLPSVWSNGKGVASPSCRAFHDVSASFLSATRDINKPDISRHVPVCLESIEPVGSSPSPNPYGSFVPPPDSNLKSVPMQRSGLSRNVRRPSSSHRYSSTSIRATSYGIVLKSGRLLWKAAKESEGHIGPLSGFEKALRRRQTARHQAPTSHGMVFVTLEESDAWGADARFVSPDVDTPAFRSAATTGHPFAGLGAKGLPALENGSLLPLRSPTIPDSLGDQSRWVPPSSWDVFNVQSDDHESCSGSPNSSLSDPLRTPTSSQPSSPKERQKYLNVYTGDLAKCCSVSTSHRALLMSLRFTYNSTVQIRSSLSNAATPAGSSHPQQWQLVVTGERADLHRPQNLHLPPYLCSAMGDAPLFQGNICGEATVCVLASHNKTDLNEWLYCIEEAIRDCKSTNRDRSDTSCTRLDMACLIEQHNLQDSSEQSLQRGLWHAAENDRHAMPRLVSHAVSNREDRNASAAIRNRMTGFPASLVGSHDTKLDAVAGNCTTSSSTRSARYDLEDAYASILQRFSDYEHRSPSPLESSFCRELASPTINARPTESLDVPVSPCDYEVSQDHWGGEVEALPSPVDPWLHHACRRSASGLNTCNKDPYADEVVMQIFAEGFRGTLQTA